MSKKVVWPEAVIHKPKRQSGTYSSLKEALEKAHAREDEYKKTQEYLIKAHAPMVKLLELRLKKGDPLFVMRPLSYTTSTLNSDDDDGFYKSSGSGLGKFVDRRVTINPGTKLLLKSIDPQLQEFIFEDGMGKEHCINYAFKNLLLTQTDIFETVRDFIEQNSDA